MEFTSSVCSGGELFGHRLADSGRGLDHGAPSFGARGGVRDPHFLAATRLTAGFLTPLPEALEASLPQTVSVSRRVTTYGSQLALGRRSSAYPLPSFSTCHGMRIEAPRSETP